MFHKVVTLLSKQNLNDNVNIDLLKSEGILINNDQSNNCNTNFIIFNEYILGPGKYSICCHGRTNYDNIKLHDKLISWRLFGIINYLYYSDESSKASLINNLINIINKNKELNDDIIINNFIISSQTDLSYKILSNLSMFIYNTRSSINQIQNTNEDKLSEFYYNNQNELSKDEKSIITVNKCKILNSLFNRLDDIINDETKTDNVDQLTKGYYLLSIMIQDNSSLKFFNNLNDTIKILDKENNELEELNDLNEDSNIDL